MSLAAQKRLLDAFIQSMFTEGIVNERFYQYQAIKEAVSPEYVVRLVTIYCVAAKHIFQQMTVELNQPDVNFDQISAYGYELFTRSTNIGAEHVRLACVEIVRACEKNSKDKCSQALYWTKNEFSQLQRKFENVVQMERKIIDLTNAMALSILKGLLQQYTQSLFEEGVVNDQFSQLLKSADRPDSMLHLIVMYCHDVEAILSELKSYIDLPDVNYHRLAMQVRKIEEKSLCIGVEQVRLACANLIQACEGKHKENVSWALTWMKNDFDHTRKRLESYAQMERRIIRLKSKQQKSCSCDAKSSVSLY